MKSGGGTMDEEVVHGRATAEGRGAGGMAGQAVVTMIAPGLRARPDEYRFPKGVRSEGHPCSRDLSFAVSSFQAERRG